MNIAAPERDPLELCAQEPIRIPGSIQPHGALLVLSEGELAIVQASANAGHVLGIEVPAAAKPALGAILGDDFAADVGRWAGGEDAHYLKHWRFGAVLVSVSGHRARQGLVLEFEPSSEESRNDTHYPRLRRFMEQADAITGVTELCQLAAEQYRQLTGFDRVMIYRFDPEWNGTVIAEHGNGTLPSYLDLRFPASDIPAQARELYRLNRLRLIPSADYEPVPLVPPMCPVDGAPLDMSFAALRSVSPIHLAYMRNMGTAASMSVSIIIDGALWGLVSCHHATPRHVGPQVRAACDFFGQILAQQIASRERAAEIGERLRLKQIEVELIAHLTRAPSFQEGLVSHAGEWLSVTNSQGAAVLVDNLILTAGRTPATDDIQKLAEWIHRRGGDDTVFSTDRLAMVWPEGERIADVASGVLAVSISRLHPSYIIWFRPEVVRTVRWGGDPNKEAAIDASGRLNPRRSFEIWKEAVHHRALDWTPAERFSASDFRTAVLDFVLKRAEERALLTEELQRTNKELESFSYSVSHDLRAPFRHIVGYAQLLGDEEPGLKGVSLHYLQGIRNAALSAGQLVDDLLHFSQLGRANLAMSRIDMNKVLAEVRRSVDVANDAIEWEVSSLPTGWGDAGLVRQAMFNLVDNAVKYSAKAKPPRVRITGTERARDVLYSVEDNGVGFDMAYAGKLFQVFQRLHRQEEFGGTGIGLALTKRIVDRHGGTLEARGSVGKGAVFSFSLPKPRTEGGREDA